MVDCTAGNGHDSLELAKIVALKDGVGKMYSIDVQASARYVTVGSLRRNGWRVVPIPSFVENIDLVDAAIQRRPAPRSSAKA